MGGQRESLFRLLRELFLQSCFQLNPQNTADQLATFLSAMSFPALRSLEFRDWVDRASLNDNLSLLLVFLYDLLSSLKLPHLTRIEWSNSESTAAGEPSMVYERQNGTAKWNLRKWLSE